MCNIADIIVLMGMFTICAVILGIYGAIIYTGIKG